MWKVAMKIEGTFQCSSHVALSGLRLLDPIRLPNDDELVFSNPQKKICYLLHHSIRPCNTG